MIIDTRNYIIVPPLANVGVTLVPNPCFLEINGVRFSCTSQDPLMPLLRNTIMRNQTATKLEELMKLVLFQRSWFPSVDSRSQLTNGVDITLREQYEFIRRVSRRTGKLLDDDSDAAGGGSNRVGASSAGGRGGAVGDAIDEGLVLAEQDSLLEDIESAVAGPGGAAAASPAGPTGTRANADVDVQTWIPDVLVFSTSVGKGFVANKIQDRIFASPGSCCKSGGVGNFLEMWLHPGEGDLAKVNVVKLVE